MAHETQTLQPGLLRSSITRIPEGVTQHSAAQHTTAWHMAAQRSSTCLYASRRYITRPLAWSTAEVPAGGGGASRTVQIRFNSCTCDWLPRTQ